MGRKKKDNKVPKVHPELKGLDLNINEFGELISNIDMDKINAFLTRNVPDKKLMNRHDDAYQQDFKEAELAANASEEEDDAYVEESGENEEGDDFENITDDDVDLSDEEDTDGNETAEDKP